MSIIKRKRCFFAVLLTFSSSVFLFNSVIASNSCDNNYIESMNSLIEQTKDETDGIVKKIPNSIVIAQAVLESNCGKSSPAKNKKNHFGLLDDGKIISFPTVKRCIEFYFENLDANSAYKSLRRKLTKPKIKLDTLVITLARAYAEDKRYPQKILKIIDKYDLSQYD